MKPIKVLSLNCLGTPLSFNKRSRFTLLVKEIKRIKPDVVALQEIIFKRDRLFLEKELLSEGYSFFPEEHSYRSGAIVTLSRLPIVSQEYKTFREQGPLLPLSIAMRSVKKGFHVSTLKIKGTTIKVINTHLAANFHNTKKEVRAIERQMRELVTYINKQSKKAKLIVCGDFNIPSHTEQYTELVTDAGLVDPLVNGNHVTFSPNNLNRKYKLMFLLDGWGKRTGMRFDYIFHKGFSNIPVKQKVVFDRPIHSSGRLLHLSDHFGVLAEIFLVK